MSRIVHLYDYQSFMRQFSNLRHGEVLGLCGWEPEAIMLVDQSDKALVNDIVMWFKANDAPYKRIPNTGIFLVLKETDSLICKLSL